MPPSGQVNGPGSLLLKEHKQLPFPLVAEDPVANACRNGHRWSLRSKCCGRMFRAANAGRETSTVAQNVRFPRAMGSQDETQLEFR